MPSHEMKYTTFLIVNDDETSGESQSGIHSNVAVTVIEPSVQSLVCENQLVSVMVNRTDSSTSQETIGNGGDSVPGCSGMSAVSNSKCSRIGLTFGTSTAMVERSFSSLRRIHTYLRSTMTQDRLDDLAILNIERDLSSELWNEMETLVVKFSQVHGNAKIVLI